MNLDTYYKNQTEELNKKDKPSNNDKSKRYYKPFIEPPEEVNLLTSFMYLAASFFTHTDNISFEHQTKDSQVRFNYTGIKYPAKWYRRKK